MPQINAAKLDLTLENAIECGSSYERVINVCDQPDLTEFVGYCEFKKGAEKILEAVITVVSKDSYKLSVPWTLTDVAEFRTLVSASGDIFYDVLFVKSSTSERFYSVRGKAVFINTITQV